MDKVEFTWKSAKLGFFLKTCAYCMQALKLVYKKIKRKLYSINRHIWRVRSVYCIRIHARIILINACVQYRVTQDETSKTTGLNLILGSSYLKSFKSSSQSHPLLWLSSIELRQVSWLLVLPSPDCTSVDIVSHE